MKKYILVERGVQKNVIIGHMRHSSRGDLVSRHTSTSICVGYMGNGGGVVVSEGMANKEDLFVDPCGGRAELSLSGPA